MKSVSFSCDTLGIIVKAMDIISAAINVAEINIGCGLWTIIFNELSWLIVIFLNNYIFRYFF